MFTALPQLHQTGEHAPPPTNYEHELLHGPAARGGAMWGGDPTSPNTGAKGNGRRHGTRARGVTSGKSGSRGVGRSTHGRSRGGSLGGGADRRQGRTPVHPFELGSSFEYVVARERIEDS